MGSSLPSSVGPVSPLERAALAAFAIDPDLSRSAGRCHLHPGCLDRCPHAGFSSTGGEQYFGSTAIDQVAVSRNDPFITGRRQRGSIQVRPTRARGRAGPFSRHTTGRFPHPACRFCLDRLTLGGGMKQMKGRAESLSRFDHRPHSSGSLAYAFAA